MMGRVVGNHADDLGVPQVAVLHEGGDVVAVGVQDIGVGGVPWKVSHGPAVEPGAPSAECGGDAPRVTGGQEGIVDGREGQEREQ